MNTIYLWTGERATFGNPNPRTGLYNRFGDLHFFDSVKEAEEHLEKHHSDCGVYTITRSKNKIRKYFLGMSMARFNDMLAYGIEL